MGNHYLIISKRDDEGYSINSSDGVFSSLARMSTKKKVSDYCEERAEEWLNSDLSNYNKFKKEQREIIANKWLKAKELSEGVYNGYFNSDPIKEFYIEVAELAKTFGINNYNLSVND